MLAMGWPFARSKLQYFQYVIQCVFNLETWSGDGWEIELLFCWYIDTLSYDICDSLSNLDQCCNILKAVADGTREFAAVVISTYFTPICCFPLFKLNFSLLSKRLWQTHMVLRFVLLSHSRGANRRYTTPRTYNFSLEQILWCIPSIRGAKWNNWLLQKWHLTLLCLMIYISLV